MDLVLECGAGYDIDEHYIATELFVKDQGEMFMTLPRFNWLRRKYNVKYGNCGIVFFFMFSFSSFELLSLHNYCQLNYCHFNHYGLYHLHYVWFLYIMVCHLFNLFVSSHVWYLFYFILFVIWPANLF